MSYHYLVLFVVLGLRLWELYYSWRRLAEDRRAAQAEPVSEPVFPAMVAVHSAWLVGCLVEVVVVHPQFHASLVHDRRPPPVPPTVPQPVPPTVPPSGGT